jgi:hypothetical protein
MKAPLARKIQNIELKFNFLNFNLFLHDLTNDLIQPLKIVKIP